MLAIGKKVNENRTKPYAPIFKRTPAKITEPPVGASTCASGNQIWSGNIGIFIANEIKKANHKINCFFSENFTDNNIWKSVEPASKKIKKIDNNIKTEPIKVYKKNW